MAFTPMLIFIRFQLFMLILSTFTPQRLQILILDKIYWAVKCNILEISRFYVYCLEKAQKTDQNCIYNAFLHFLLYTNGVYRYRCILPAIFDFMTCYGQNNSEGYYSERSFSSNDYLQTHQTCVFNLFHSNTITVFFSIRKTEIVFI